MSNVLQVATILGCKNSMLREGLKHILSNTSYRVVPEDLAHGRSLEALWQGGTPSLAIIDNNLYPDGIGLAVSELKDRLPGIRVVILADAFDLEELKEVLQAGADGYCLATTGCEALVKYLDLIMLGEVVFPSSAVLSVMASVERRVEPQAENQVIRVPVTSAERLAEAKDAVIRTLSSREAEILHCLMEGAPNKVIARKLEVAEATVKVHIKAILRKIRVANRTQAAMWAVSHLSDGGADTAWLQAGERLPPQDAALIKML
jgi:two-component system, NarL family, nitrate/nitrite response regulator NarL